MQESMTAALTWVRSNAEKYAIDPDFFRKTRHSHSRAVGGGSEGRSIRRRSMVHRAGQLCSLVGQFAIASP